MPAAYRSIYVTFEANTQKLGTALKQIDSEASSVDRNLKEINKGLKLDPGNAELVSRKFNTLAEGIDVARKRLEMLKDAKKQADEQLARTDSSTQQYKNLETQIASLDKEIERSAQKLSNYQTQIKQTASSMMNDVKVSAEELGAVLGKTTAAIAAVVTALGGITMSSATAVDNLNTLSKTTGVSVENLQKFQYASKLIDVSQETLSQSLRKLTMNMQSAEAGTGKAAEAFEALGIKYKNFDGTFRDSEDVFNDLIDALHDVDDEAMRDAYAMNLFGRSAMDLNPLILAGSDALKQYGEQAELFGLVFEGDTLDGLQEFQDEIDIAKRKLEGAKIIVGSELVSAFDKLTGGVDGLLKMVQQAKADGTLKTIANDVASAVSITIDLLAKAAKIVYQFRVEIAAGVTALVTFKTAMAIAKFIEATVTAVKVLTSALKGYTVAQEAANAAAMANPYVALAAGIAAVSAALTVYITKSATAAKEDAEEIVVLSEETQQCVEATQALTEASESLREERRKSLEDVSAEKSAISDLVDSIIELSEQQNLSSGEYERLSQYIDKLNDSVPGLNLAFDKQTNSLNLTADAMRNMTESYSAYRQLQIEIDKNAAFKSNRSTLWYKLREVRDKQDKAQTAAVWEGASWDDWAALEDQAEALIKEIKALDEEIAASDENIKVLSDDASQYSKILKELEEEKRKAAEEAEKEAKAAEKLKTAYKEAKNVVSKYKSELKDLIGILDNVNKDTAYSTSQILDLIEKYPQLTSAIHASADGYIIEADAVRKLTQAKADDLVASSKAQLAALEAQKASLGNSLVANVVKSGLDVVGDKIESQIAMYQQIADDISNGRIYSGSSSSGGASSSGNSAENDWLKERKEAAKAEEAELENQFKTEKISAEEYYNGLMDIARRYYAGIGELREEYLSAENKVYEGLKKAQEDELSTAKKLEDQLRAVKEAEDALKNAQTQQVQVYSGAAGFHAEANTAAIEKARQTLADKNYNLTETLLKNARFNGESLSERLRNIGMADIRDLLPDLSGLRLPSLGGGTTTNNNTSTRNLTYNGGDINITIQGNVDPQTMPTLKTSIEDAVRAGINAFLDEENAAGQVGGI